MKNDDAERKAVWVAILASVQYYLRLKLIFW